MSHHLPFRKRSAAAVYEQHSGPNMTPMVDIVMVILIFFMASAAILGPEWFVATRLPKAGAVRAGDPAQQPLKLRLVVGRDSTGASTLTINDAQPVIFESSAAAIQSQVAGRDLSEVLILIDPAPNAGYEDVVRLHSICQQLGLTKVGLGSASQLTPPVNLPAD